MPPPQRRRGRRRGRSLLSPPCVVGASRMTSEAARPCQDGAPRVTSGAEAGAVHQHQRPPAGSGHGAALRDSPSSCSFPFPGPGPSHRTVGLQCQPVLEVGRRRRRTETRLSGPAAPFARRTLPGPQLVGASGVQQPPLLRPLHTLLFSEAWVTSSPGRSWTFPN